MRRTGIWRVLSAAVFILLLCLQTVLPFGGSGIIRAEAATMELPSAGIAAVRIDSWENVAERLGYAAGEYLPLVSVPAAPGLADGEDGTQDEDGSCLVFAPSSEEGMDEVSGPIGVADVLYYIDVYTDCDETAETAGYLYRGSAARILKTESDWSYISSGNLEGWVESEYLATDGEAEELVGEINPRVAVVTSDNLNVREDADLSSDVLLNIEGGTDLAVLAADSDWVKVRITSDTVGYIARDYTDIEDGLYTGVTLEEEEEMRTLIRAKEEERAEEEARLAEEAAERAAAEAAEARAAESSSQAKSSSSGSGKSSSSGSSSGKSSSSGSSSPGGSSGSSSPDSGSSGSSSGSSSSGKSSGSSSSESSSSDSGWVSLGTFRTTAYCGCSVCNGGSNAGKTATGAVPTAGHTIAVDKSVIPLGSRVKINGTVYVAEDTGVSGKTIDIFFSSHSAALSYGVKNVEVYIYKG